MKGRLGGRWHGHLALWLIVVGIYSCGVPTSFAQSGRHLRIQWQAGTVTSYQLESTADSPDIGGKPVHEILSGLETVRFGSVDANGNATVEVSLIWLGQNSNGNSSLFQLKVATDGRVLDNPDGQAYVLPQFYQVFPLLPPGSVQVGDVWSETYDLPDPLLGAPYHVFIDATYARNETLNGTDVVVIQARLTSVFDKTVPYAKLWGAVPQGYPADETIREIGTKADEVTFWFDPTHQELIKSSGTEQLEYVGVFASPSTGAEFGRNNVIWTQSVTFANTLPPSGAGRHTYR